MAERDRHDKRTQKRFTKRCEVEFVSEGLKLRGIANNFSLTGLFIRTNHPAALDTTLDLLVFLSDSSTSRLKVRVVRAYKTPTGKVMGTPVKSGTNGMGVRIVERDANYLNFFKSLLDCRMEREDKHRGVIEETAPDPVAARERKDLIPADLVAVLTKVVKQQQQSLDEQKAAIDAKSRIIEEQQKTLETLAAAVARLEAEMRRLKNGDRDPISPV